MGNESAVLGEQAQELALTPRFDVTQRARKRALLVAFHYPPFGISSGLQRTLALSRHLQEYGWQPAVLTVHPRAYQAVREDQLEDIPDGVPVKRAFAIDVQRALRGPYPKWLALPDRWSSWFPSGVLSGLNLVRKHKPTVIWSTFPIATAHLIALTLHRITGIPWIADFRDPMTEPNYPDRPGHLWLERRVVARAAYLSFTAPSTLKMYAERYPQRPRDSWLELPNGYDEEIFRSAAARPSRPARDAPPIVLVHSGVLYPAERDPRPFFAAIAALKAAGKISAGSLRVVLRAAGHDEIYAKLLADAGVADIVELAGAIPYRAALAEMLEADGLLIFQGASCNIQIPAKIYECLRANRPLFALTDAAGDTAGVLRDAGVTTMAPIDDPAAIASGLLDFLGGIRSGTAPLPSERFVASYSRKVLTAKVAAAFDAVTA